TTIRLSIALVLALILVWWAQSSSNKPKGPSSDHNLWDPPLADISTLEIQQADGPTLKFTADGANWNMLLPVVGPSENYVVNGSASHLKDLKFLKAYSKSDPDRPTDDMTSLNKPPELVKFTDKNGRSGAIK